LPQSSGNYTVGVLVQTNFGGGLTIDGEPVWRELRPPDQQGGAGGSCMIVVATDAPLDARQLKRMAARAIFGMARTGAAGDHSSGDYVIAFSTTNRFLVEAAQQTPIALVREDQLSPLFRAARDATEEAIYNSLLRATTVRGHHGRVAEAIPIEPLREILRRHQAR